MRSTSKGGEEKGRMGACCPGTSTLSVRTGKKSRRLCAKINESDTTWRPRPLLMFVPFALPLPQPPFCAGSISLGIVLGAVSRRPDEWLEGGRTKGEKEGKRETGTEREKGTIGHPSRSQQPPVQACWRRSGVASYEAYRKHPNIGPDAASRRFDSRLNKPPPPWIPLHLSTVLHAASRRGQSEFRSEARVRNSLQVGCRFYRTWRTDLARLIYFLKSYLNEEIKYLQYATRSFLVWFSL